MDLREQLSFCGNNVTIWSLAKIVYPENISIGDETVIDDFCFLDGGGKGIKIGKFCHIVVHSIVKSGGLLEIGDFTGIAYRCTILAGTDDYYGAGLIGLKVFGDKYRKQRFSDTIIGRHVHIGAGSIVLPGVTIGDGCSIGAGSLVNKDLPEWTICYGSPCKPIKPKPRDRQLEIEKEFLEEYAKRKNK